MNETEIAWTDLTWNPWSGCKKVSPGCAHCYAETLAEQKRGTAAFPNGFDLTWRPHKLREPKSIKKPSLIFANSMSDFALESATDEMRDLVVDIIEATPQHQYQVLTKRPENLLRYSKRRRLPSNFWAGVTVEDFPRASRIDVLRQVDVEVRFVSAEPLLSSLAGVDLSGIHWVIAGGESGLHLQDPKVAARRALVEKVDGKWVPRADGVQWCREIRDMCSAGGVAFFFKQWGGVRPKSGGSHLDGKEHHNFPRVPSGHVRRPNLLPLFSP